MTYQITIPVGLASEFHTPSFRLVSGIHLLSIHFTEGRNVYTSPDIVLGQLHGVDDSQIIGRFSFRYEYNKTRNTIKICGTDYPSVDGMTLTTIAADELCIEHACNGGFMADEGYHNRFWNYHSKLVPGAAQVIKQVVRDASNTLIERLREDQSCTILVRSILPDLPQHVYTSLCAVHHNGKFLEMYDPQHTYSTDMRIGNVESQVGGLMSLLPAEDFANVIGSTGDPEPAGYKAWLKVWEGQYGKFNFICTSQGYPVGYTCNNLLYGGHCIKGPKAKQVDWGDDDVVFIIPICNHHNNYKYEGAMRPINTNQGVWLLNYHQ